MSSKYLAAFFAGLLISINVLVGESYTIDDAEDIHLGVVAPHRPSVEVDIMVAPLGRHAITSFFEQQKLSLILENGKRINEPIRFIGWKLPEYQSVVLVKGIGDKRKLLVAGKEVDSYKNIHDAVILNQGQKIAPVLIQEAGMTWQGDGLALGPAEQIEVVDYIDNIPVIAVQDQGKHSVYIGDAQYETQGTPIRFLKNKKYVVWEEIYENGKRAAVINGERSAKIDRVRGGIHFSLNGEHVTYVLRNEGKYTAWLNGKKQEAEKTIVTLRAFNDGQTVFAELWQLPPEKKGKRPVNQCRITVRGKQESRILQAPVYSFLQLSDGGFIGVARQKELSVIVRISAEGSVSYEEIKGLVGLHLSPNPDASMVFFTYYTDEGLMVYNGGKLTGPYDKVSRPVWLNFSKTFGYVIKRSEKVYVVIGERFVPVELNDFYEPVFFSETELTSVVVGTLQNSLKEEIWSRAILLD